MITLGKPIRQLQNQEPRLQAHFLLRHNNDIKTYTRIPLELFFHRELGVPIFRAVREIKSGVEHESRKN